MSSNNEILGQKMIYPFRIFITKLIEFSILFILSPHPININILMLAGPIKIGFFLISLASLVPWLGATPATDHCFDAIQTGNLVLAH